MFRIIMILVVGISIGYFVGFSDGRTHKDNIVKRIVDRVGGSARGGVGNDIDARYDKIGR